MLHHSSTASGSRSADKRALGSNGRSVDTLARKASRLSAFSAKRTAAWLLRPLDEKWAGRVSACGYVAWSGDVDLMRAEHANGEKSGSFSGLVSCKSVWACPVCSARISSARRDEMNTLLAWSRSAGHSVVMLTLTARHDRSMALAPFLAALKDAAKRFRQSRGWRGLGAVGSVTATEVTHGRNGWHPHFHFLLILPADLGCGAVEALRSEWLHSLQRSGLEGQDAAFQVQSAQAAGDYIGKFGAAEELTLGHVKLGRSGSRSPWQLLADARDGDKRAGRLWVEFASAFKGRRQLVWSRGLKALAGVDELTDEQLPEDPEPVRLRRWSGSSDGWRSARRRRCSLVDAAESGGDLDRAEFGPTDAMRWREEVALSQLLE